MKGRIIVIGASFGGISALVSLAKLLPAAWHWVQATLACAPVNGNFVALWLNVAVSHDVVLWHCWHVCGKPLVT